MKRRFILLSAIIVLFTCAMARTIYIKYKHHPKYYMDNTSLSDYEKEWKKVDSLEANGLPQSALEVVNVIYAKATKEKNAGQVVKAVIHRLKFTSYVEEDAFVLSLVDLKKEADIAEFPAKQILSSMLAEMYWNYYQQNRYRFLNRTTTQQFDAADIRTWDLQKIVENVQQNYQHSLDGKDQLTKTSIDVYGPILSTGTNTKELRPSLYDFLVNRAIDFYSQTESSLTKPAEEFILREEDYFAPVDKFVSQKIVTADTLNFTWHAIKLTQELLQFRLGENNIPALMDVDLKRLAFVYNKSVHPRKQELYLSALKALEEKYKDNPVSVDATFQIAQVFFNNSKSYNPLLSDAHKWEAKQAFDICAAGISRFPKSNGAQDCRSLQSSIEQKTIQLTFEKVNLPDEPFRTLVTYKGVNKLFFIVIKTTPEEYSKIHGKDDYYYDNKYKEKIIKFYASRKAVQQFEVKLPLEGDYQQHAAEAKIPALPVGDYIILAGTNSSLSYQENAVAYDFITVSSISYIQRNLPSGEMEFHVLDRKTGTPLSTVSAQLYNDEYDYGSRRNKRKPYKSFVSDKEGYFKVPAPKQYINYSVEFKVGEDRLYTGNEYTGNYYRDVFYQTERGYDDTTTHTVSFFFTDRAIYRPGQTIYFKGIVLDTDNRKRQQIKKQFHSSVTLYDVNGQAVKTLDLITNEYGTYSGTFTAPSAGLNGMMRIEDGYGSTSVSVEDYKRPKFEVTINNIQGAFRLEDNVKITGNAKAYSGANVDNAMVKYRVVRNAIFPYWWYCRWGYYPTSPEMEIANGASRSDDKGAFEINFKAIPDWSVPKDSKPTYNYTVYADVTDQNGETRSAEKNVSIGYAALKVSVSLPASLERETKGEFDINTTNLAGEFEPSTGIISIYHLKSPIHSFRERLWQRPDTFLLSKEDFYKAFPNDLYDDENNSLKWERQDKVQEEKFDTKQSKTIKFSDLKKWKSGSYVLEIASTDKFGEQVKEVSYFTVIDKKETSLPVTTVDWFSILKGNAEPGGKAEILAGSSDKITVLYEWEKDNKVFNKQWLSFNGEQKLLQIPITEEHRGNIGLHYTFIRNNRLYSHTQTITVPYTNKQLDVAFETFRNKLLPGEKEEWKIRIRGKQGEKVAAEMVATLYDASLDAFRANSFDFNIYNYSYATLGWHSTNGFNKEEATIYDNEWNHSLSGYYKYYDALNWFNYSPYYRRGRMMSKKMKGNPQNTSTDTEEYKEAVVAMDSAPAPGADLLMTRVSGIMIVPDEAGKSGKVAQDKLDPNRIEEPVKARTNFNETAFFYPQLQTDASGDLLISFTIPEALTRWKMLGFAHTQDMKYGFATNELVTQKELMITSSAPRFFREGDKIVFTSKVTNLSENDLSGQAQLYLFDAMTMKPIDQLFANQVSGKPFSAKKGQSTGLSWALSIPEGVEAVTYRVVAKAGSYSDGEEMPVPILTNRMLVTESMPLWVRSNQTKVFKLDKLVSNQSATLRNHKLTLEFTSNPAWYAIQALPYLMEYPYECAEQTFSRFYANSIASHIANSSPKIKAVFDSWRNTDSKALLSNLEKNQELKSLLLEETPWVMDAKDESERKKRVALLFDLNRMSNELQRAITKLSKMQTSNGGWPWFEGMRESDYITQHIVTGLGHLDHLGIKNIRQDETVWKMATAGVSFMDDAIRRQYEELKRLEKKKQISLADDHLGYSEIQYLYARSYFKDLPVDKKTQEAFDYYKGQAKKYWLSKNRYMQGMIALGLSRLDEKAVPAAIVKSLREFAIVKDEMGMYWKNDAGFYWYQAPVETQALLIEVFDEVAKDQKAVDDMKVWLLKQKQTQNWETTKATTEACFALLLKGTDWLATESNVEIKVGDQVVDPKKIDGVKAEAGTGYFKTSWSGSDIKPEMGNVTVTKKDAGVSWGALYWQYFEKLDKITPHDTPLKLKKELFLQQARATGPVITPITDKTSLHPGDLIKVRIELRVDRDMEYVHMKDMRASGLEPTNVLSQYKYQDGLGYYESTRDAATNFFFDYLPKGTYVFEYPLRVTHTGDFSNGITNIQCMYAPEFGSHSQGVRVKVTE